MGPDPARSRPGLPRPDTTPLERSHPDHARPDHPTDERFPEADAAGGCIGVVLAAGRGARFGSTKQLAKLRGRPLVAHAVDVLARAGLDVVVVVGPGTAGQAVAAAARAADATTTVVVNPDPQQGMGSSLAVAAHAAGRRGLVVVLADQPVVPVADVVAVAEALSAGARAVQVSYRDGGRGHPVGFGRDLHDGVRRLVGDGTGRGLLVESDPVVVAVDHDRPVDVDTVRDLEDLATRRAASRGRAADPTGP